MPQTIRILHVLHAFSAGGLENGIVNLINRSPEHLVHELCLLSKSGEFVDRLTRPVVVHEMNKKSGNGLGLMFGLRGLFQRRHVDIIHTRNWAAFDGVLASCLTPKPVLIHGEHGRDISDPEGKIYRRNLARRLLAFRATKFVAVSRDLYTWLRQTVRIPKSKLTFIPNGVDTDRFSPVSRPDATLRKEFGIGDHEFVVGTIGRLDPVKNHQGLIRAVRRLQEGGNPVRLVIAGDGPLRHEIETSAKQSLVEPNALVLGYRPDVERLYRIFDMFVLNSFAEGMSNTLLEAMASGLPVICTAVGGNVELVKNRETGFLISPGDDAALANAIEDYGARSKDSKTVATKARNLVVDSFSLTHMIDQYTALYNSVA
jgi:sugar transferase (PEP-CTERM/EpsH1 system associated)